MMAVITPKKVNKASDLMIDATFQYQGVRYSERYKSKGNFISSLKRKKKDIFINAVDYNTMEVITRDTLAKYISK